MEITIKRFIIVSLALITYLKFAVFGIRNPYLFLLFEHNQLLLKITFIVLISLLYNQELILYWNKFTTKGLLFYSIAPSILLLILNSVYLFLLYGSFLIGLFSFNTFFILSTLIIGPVYEELFYRFILINNEWSFKLKLGALIFSAILFAYGHVEVTNGALLDMIQFLIMGIVFGLIYIKSNNILYSMSAHIFYNGLILLLSVISAY